MTVNEQFLDPVLITFRKGTADDPYVSLHEVQKIINARIVLHEIPDEFTHVKVTGYLEIYSGQPAATEFLVDYQNGVMTFHTAQEGLSVPIDYLGTGYIQYPAERIYAHNKDKPDVIQNLQDVINNAQGAIDATAVLTQKVAESDSATAKANAVADSFVLFGDYDSTKGYVPRNMVTYQGSTYINIKASTGALPTDTTSWKVAAEKGSVTNHTHTGGTDGIAIPLTGIDSTAKTSAGGTESSKLAVTNAQGAVGNTVAWNGKRMFEGPTQPTAPTGGFLVGDVWMNTTTANDSRMCYWNGTKFIDPLKLVD